MQDRMTRTRMWTKYGAEPNPGIIFQAIADDMIVATSSKKHPVSSQTGCPCPGGKVSVYAHSSR